MSGCPRRFSDSRETVVADWLLPCRFDSARVSPPMSTRPRPPQSRTRLAATASCVRSSRLADAWSVDSRTQRAGASASGCSAGSYSRCAPGLTRTDA